MNPVITIFLVIILLSIIVLFSLAICELIKLKKLKREYEKAEKDYENAQAECKLAQAYRDEINKYVQPTNLKYRQHPG